MTTYTNEPLYVRPATPKPEGSEAWLRERRERRADPSMDAEGVCDPTTPEGF